MLQYSFCGLSKCEVESSSEKQISSCETITQDVGTYQLKPKFHAGASEAPIHLVNFGGRFERGRVLTWEMLEMKSPLRRFAAAMLDRLQATETLFMKARKKESSSSGVKIGVGDKSTQKQAAI